MNGMDGAENWSWSSFDTAIRKSETFTPPSDNIAKEAQISFNPKDRGTNGPIHASYPG